MTIVILTVVVALAAACAGQFQNLDDASAKFSAPPAFEFESSEEFNAFEELSKTLTFSTELTGAEACEAARLALQDWAGIEPGEETDPGPGNFCVFAVLMPPSLPAIEYASVRVGRDRTGDSWVADSGEAGGVSRVVVAFFDPKQ